MMEFFACRLNRDDKPYGKSKLIAALGRDEVLTPTAGGRIDDGVDFRLLSLDNGVPLPHMGSATIEGPIAMGEEVVINIKIFADDHRPSGRAIGSMR